MKKLSVLLLAVIFMLGGCSFVKDTSVNEQVSENQDLLRVKEEIHTNDRLFGIAFLGYAEGSFNSVKEELKKKSYNDKMSFLMDVAQDHFCENEGHELYAIVPVDETVTITVSKYEHDESFNFTTGEKILEVSDGKPVIVRGNMAEFIPNIIIKADNGSRKTEYTPSLSGEDGRLHVMNNEVYDFSVYD